MDFEISTSSMQSLHAHVLHLVEEEALKGPVLVAADVVRKPCPGRPNVTKNRKHILRLPRLARVVEVVAAVGFEDVEEAVGHLVSVMEVHNCRHTPSS